MPQPLSRQDLTKLQNILRLGSLSFYYASAFLGQSFRKKIFMFYSWCRYCDDYIDSFEEQNLDKRKLHYQKLKKLTLKAYNSNEKINDPLAFKAFQFLATRNFIPKDLALHLLCGMEHDANKGEVENFPDLLLYCYRVAGVVGQIFCHLLDLRNPRALDHADSLGKAMQLTNISRDIAEDFQEKRRYLPTEWLREKHLSEENFNPHLHLKEALFFRKRLIKKAEVFYKEGLDGIVYLPFRAALGVSVAAYIYREIGRKILRKSPKQIDLRVYTRFYEKLYLSFLAFFFVLHRKFISRKSF